MKITTTTIVMWRSCRLPASVAVATARTTATSLTKQAKIILVKNGNKRRMNSIHCMDRFYSSCTSIAVASTVSNIDASRSTVSSDFVPINDATIGATVTAVSKQHHQQQQQFRWNVDPITGLITATSSSKSSQSSQSSSLYQFQLVIGLEIHAQLNTSHKLFSSGRGPGVGHDKNINHHRQQQQQQQQQQHAPNDFRSGCVQLYDIAIPGTLPIIQGECVQLAILAAAALFSSSSSSSSSSFSSSSSSLRNDGNKTTNAAIHTIQNVSRFERKHYTYPDLPAGYQITQQRWPLVSSGGYVEYESLEKKMSSSSSTKSTTKPVQVKKSCRINRIQLEQDTGKTISTTRTKTKTKTKTNTNTKNPATSAAPAVSSTIITPITSQETITTKTTVSYSQIDFNRSGMALIEIVTEPDLCSSQNTIDCIQTIRQLLQHCNVCLGKMELGQFRVDANVNVVYIDASTNTSASTSTSARNDNPTISSCISNGSTSSSATGTTISNTNNTNNTLWKTPRVEIKNLNSIQQIKNSIEYEAIRQAQQLIHMLLPVQSVSATAGDLNNYHNNNNSYDPSEMLRTMKEETRTWNVSTNTTELLRYKDGSEDYRFLPDPDLPPLVLDRTLLKGCDSVSEYIERYLPELPNQAIVRFMKKYGLSEYLAKVISSDPSAVIMLDEAIEYFRRSLHDTTSNTTGDTQGHNSSSRSYSVDNEEEEDTLIRTAATTIANLICNELFALVKVHVVDVLGYDEQDSTVAYSNVTGTQLGEIVILLLVDECISKTIAKQLLSILYNDPTLYGQCPRIVATERDLQLITDPTQLRIICEQICSQYPDEARLYHRQQQRGADDANNDSNNNNKNNSIRTENGTSTGLNNKHNKFKNNAKIIKHLTGKIMSLTSNRAHPERVQEILQQVLDDHQKEDP